DEAVARQRAADARAERRRRDRALIASMAVAVGAVLVVWLSRTFGAPLRHASSAAWRRVLNSEPMYFRRVIRASRAGDAEETYVASLAWLDRIWNGHGVPMTLERAARVSRDQTFGEEGRTLAARLFGDPHAPQTPWSGVDFARAVATARPRLL